MHENPSYRPPEVFNERRQGEHPSPEIDISKDPEGVKQMLLDTVKAYVKTPMIKDLLDKVSLERIDAQAARELGELITRWHNLLELADKEAEVEDFNRQGESDLQSIIGASARRQRQAA